MNNCVSFQGDFFFFSLRQIKEILIPSIFLNAVNNADLKKLEDLWPHVRLLLRRKKPCKEGTGSSPHAGGFVHPPGTPTYHNSNYQLEYKDYFY